MRSHARASDERQLQVKTLPQHLRRDSRLAASMPGCGCPSPPRGRRVWWLSLGVQSRPHLRPSARYAFGRPFCFIIFFFPFPRNTLRFSRISHDLIIWKNVCRAIRRMTHEGQLWSWISRRLFDGFKRGLRCRLRKLLAESKAGILFLVMSNYSPPEWYAWNVKIPVFPYTLT